MTHMRTRRKRLYSNNAGVAAAVRAIFSSLLQSSLVPEVATGSASSTFTRATTAYVTDWEGLQKQTLASEARFTGARRARNYLPASEDFSGWDKSLLTVTTGVSDPAGGTSAVTLTATGVNGNCYKQTTIPIGAVATSSFWIRRRTGTGAIQTESPFTGSATYAIPGISTSWQRFSVTGLVSGFSAFMDIVIATSGDEIDFWHPQMENVTGQSNQNPSEYVSVGVLSAPYHGANVDGVKYFTTLNGNTVASNVVTEATGAAITNANSSYADASGPWGILPEGVRTDVILQSRTLDNGSWTVSNAADMNAVTADQYVSTDGTTTMDKLAPKNTTAVHSLDQAFTFTAAVYTAKAILRYVPATPQRWVALVLNDGTTTWAASFDLLNGAAGAVSNCTSTIEVTALADVYEVTMTKSAAAAAAAGTVKISLNATDTATLESALRAGTETLGATSIQLEAATFSSTEVPTTTIAVARNADIVQFVSSGNLSASAMTVALDWTPDAAAMGAVFMFGTYVDASNYTAILHDGTNVTARKRIAGVNADATKALTYSAGTVYRIVARFDGTNGIDVWVAGVKGTGSATLTASQVGTNFQLGADGNSLQQAFGSVRRFAVYGTSLSDAAAAVL